MRKLTLILLLALPLLCRCDTQGPYAGKEVISYTRWGDPSEMDSTRELIAQFEKENPHIKVLVDVVSWDQYWTKMKASVAGGTAQDVWLLSAAYAEEYVNAGHLLDLTDYFEDDPELRIEDYYQQAFDDFCFEEHDGRWRPAPWGIGRMYAFPRDYNCQMLFYNRDHFDDLGLAYPDDTWTWDDLVAAAKKLTIDFDNDGIIDQWGYGGLNYQAFAHTNGGMFLDADELRGTYSSPRALEAIQFCHDLVHKYHVHPPPGLQINIGSNFQTGKVSMTVTGSWQVRKYNDSDSLWDVAPIPVDHKGRVRHQPDGGVAHGIYAKSLHKEAAWKLVKFLSSEISQRELARSGTSVPVLKKVAMSDDFLAPFDRPRRTSLKYFYEVLDAPRSPRRAPKGHLEYTEYAQQQLDAVWRDAMTPEEACRKIDKKIDEVLSDYYGDTRP